MRYLFLLSLSGILLAQSNWTLKTIAGGNEAGDGGLASLASIRYLQGVAADSLGNIYISDADDHRIRRIDPSGRITSIAGNGVAGFSGDGGPASQARLNTPYGITVSPSGDIIFADLGNGRVRRIRNGSIETIAGGGLKQIPPAGVFLRPLEVKLIAPRNVLASQSGSIFISDFGANTVLEIRADGNLTTMSTAAISLKAPAGLSLDRAGEVLVADSGNARVRKLRRDGQVEIVVASSSEVPLERPVGLAVSRDGNLFIADTRGDYLWKVANDGKPSIMAPGGRDVSVDSAGNIITAGYAWLRRVNPQGLIEILIGPTYSKYRGEDVPAVAARLNQPTGIARDSKGNIYFSDTANHRIRRVSPDGMISTVAGTGEPGYRGDGGLALQANLNAPTFLAVDEFDNVYFSDTSNHRVRVFAPGGVIQTYLGTGRIEFSGDGLIAANTNVGSPAGLAFDRTGTLFVAERMHHRIRKVAKSGKVSTVAGTSLRGSSIDGQEALAASLNSPGAIAVDGQGNLYFADTGNQSIKLVDRETQRIRSLVLDAQSVEGLAASPSGVLYFSEGSRHRVRRLSLAGELVTIAGRTNENGWNAESGDALATTLNEPSGIAISNDGALLVADRFNDRIRRIDPPQEVLAGNTQAARIVHAATFQEGAVAPGQLVSLVISDLAEPSKASITIEGIVAPISYAGRTQVNFQVPYAIAGRSQVTFELRSAGELIYRSTLNVAGAAPGLFEFAGQAIAMYSDGSLNSESKPARPLDVLTVYGTGEGLLRESGGLQVPFLPVTLDIGGIPAEVLFAGAAPGYSGLLQINLRVPAGIRSKGKVAVTLRIGAFQNPITQMLVVN